MREYCDQVTEDLSFLAASPQMVRIRQQILQIAPVDVPVFICGESGVGKEVVARMIHMRSKRRNQPFIKVNCAALPGELLESELFGFEQGAFTGAVRAKPGKFELANKGTIFLDEIAEMSHASAGEAAARTAGPPVFAARRPPFDRYRCARAGRHQRGGARGHEDGPAPRGFVLPPERALHQGAAAARAARRNSAAIPAFLRASTARNSGKTPSGPSKHLLEAAVSYPWPGNLRELENFVKRYVILEDDEGSFRELVEMSSARQRTSPREEAASAARTRV